MKSGLRSSAAFMPGIIAAALLVTSARADVVTDWNVLANALVANDVGNNPRLRTLAMVHVAMSDAIKQRAPLLRLPAVRWPNANARANPLPVPNYGNQADMAPPLVLRREVAPARGWGASLVGA
jgi:hypothetical protein